MAAGAYYPIFTDLKGRMCVVVGGGLIAQRKVTTLLKFGAVVKVIAPTLTARLADLAARERLTYVARRFRPADVRGAWLIYAATDEQSINEAVFKTAAAKRIFANVVDQQSLCSFVAPAILKRGELVIAISTSGGSPSLSKRVRQDLEQWIGPDYGRMLRVLKSVRPAAKRRLPTYADRQRFFTRLINGPVFQLVREGKAAAASRRAHELLEEATSRG